MYRVFPPGRGNKPYLQKELFRTEFIDIVEAATKGVMNLLPYSRLYVVDDNGTTVYIAERKEIKTIGIAWTKV